MRHPSCTISRRRPVMTLLLRSVSGSRSSSSSPSKVCLPFTCAPPWRLLTCAPAPSGWKQLLLADGPRQVINAITLYSFGKSENWTTDVSVYFGGSLVKAGIIITMLFTLVRFSPLRLSESFSGRSTHLSSSSSPTRSFGSAQLSSCLLQRSCMFRSVAAFVSEQPHLAAECSLPTTFLAPLLHPRELEGVLLPQSRQEVSLGDSGSLAGCSR